MAGRIAYYGNIVTNGLVLDLDAGKRDSYPGSGTTWRDISGRTNTGSLVNGPTFSSANAGSIVFDGVDDYVQYGSGSGISTDWTVSVWFYPTSVVNYKNVLDCNFGYSYTIGNLGPRLEMSTNGNLAWVWSGDVTNGSNIYYNLSTTGSIDPLQSNLWYNAVITRTSNNSSVSYLNGTLKSNTTVTVGTPSATFINVFNNIVIGKGFGAFNQTDRNMVGRIASVQIYNRVLPQSEITQNYNALKSRYGL